MTDFWKWTLPLMIIMFCLGALSGLFGVTWQDVRDLARGTASSSPIPAILVASESPLPEPSEVRMVFVGDMMLTRSVGDEMASRSDWYWPFRAVDSYIQGFDVAFGNLETTISHRGTRVGSIYSFRSDLRVAPALASAGFDILSIANNHIWDYGQVAFIDTLDHVKRAGMAYVGGGMNSDEAHAGVIRNIGGTTVGFLAYTDLLPKGVTATTSRPGVAFMTLEQVRVDVVAMRPHVDVLVVSFHWGEEYQLTHNRHQETIAHAAIDAGADLIIGHHPHVRQDIAEYQGVSIAYSLGNFIFDQSFSKETMTGLSLEVLIRNKKIATVMRRDIAISRQFQASLIPKEPAQE